MPRKLPPNKVGTPVCLAAAAEPLQILPFLRKRCSSSAKPDANRASGSRTKVNAHRFASSGSASGSYTEQEMLSVRAQWRMLTQIASLAAFRTGT